MSTDNGTTWTLFPDTTFGALTEGGDLPHVDVTDLSLSQGNIATASGMPALAGPYQTLTFSGNLTSGSTTVTGIVDIGNWRSATTLPAPASRWNDDPGHQRSTSITLSAKRRPPASRASAADPTATADPDLLWPRPTARANSPSTWHRCCSPPRSQLAPSDNAGPLPTAPDRHDRHAHHRRRQRDLRLRQHHLGLDRRRDPGRRDLWAGHRRLQPADVR